MSDRTITFRNTKLLGNNTKIRMETTAEGLVRIRPTNRVVSKDLSELTEQASVISATIPARYWAAASKDYEGATAVKLVENKHGWFALALVLEGDADATLSGALAAIEPEEEAVEQEAVEPAPMVSLDFLGLPAVPLLTWNNVKKQRNRKRKAAEA